jgi:hypothetical protein
MRIRAPFAALSLMLILSAAAPGFSDGPQPLTLSIAPTFTVPLGPGADYFGLGGGARLLAEYPLPWVAGLAAQGGLSYSLATLPYGAGTTSEIAALAGASWQAPLAPALSARAFGNLGASYGFINGDSLSQGGASLVVEAGGGIGWALSPALSLRLDLSYTWFSGAYGTVGAALGAAYGFVPSSARPPEEAPRPVPRAPRAPSLSLSIEGITLVPVFPALIPASGAQRLGSVRVRNNGAGTVSGVMVAFTAEQVLAAPAVCPAPSELAPGEEAEVQIQAVLPASLRSAQESRDVTAAVAVSYVAEGAAVRTRAAATLRVLGANVVPGEDRGEAAVFIDPADRGIQRIARTAADAVQAEATPNLDPALRSAAGCFAAAWIAGVRPAGAGTPSLGARGMDSSGMSGIGATPRSRVTRIRLPGQTLAGGGGNAADLTVLYASLLEALGETCALVDLKGGLILAVRLSLRPAEAAAALAGLAEPIVLGREVWAPMDPSAAEGSMLAAWRRGVEEWKAAGAEAESRLSRVAEVRARYRAGGFRPPAFLWAPAAGPVTRALRAEVSRLVDAQWIASAPAAVAQPRGAAGTPTGPRRLLVAVEEKDAFGASEVSAAVVEKSVSLALASLEGGPLVIEQGGEPLPQEPGGRDAAARARGADCWAVVTLTGKPSAPAASAQVSDLAAGKLFPARPVSLLRGLAPEDAARETWDDLRDYVHAVIAGTASDAGAASGRPPAAGGMTLTVLAVPGTVIRGLPGGPLFIGKGGASSQTLPRPASFPLTAEKDGFFPAAREVFVDSDRDVYFVQEPRSAWSVRLGFMNTFFPSAEALYCITPASTYVSVGVTTFMAGLAIGGDQLFTSIPLTEVAAGIGTCLFPESWLFRPYLGAALFLRVTSLAGSLPRLDPLSPGGIRASLGMEVLADARMKLFLELTPAFFYSAYPSLLEASLASNRTTAGYIFLSSGAIGFPFGRFGVRWLL